MAGKYIWSALGETQNILNKNPKRITFEGEEGEFYTLFCVREYDEDRITEYYYVEAEVPYTQSRIMTHSGFSIEQADVELQLLYKQTVPTSEDEIEKVQCFTRGDVGVLIHKQYEWSKPRKDGEKIIVSVNGQDVIL